VFLWLNKVLKLYQWRINGVPKASIQMNGEKGKNPKQETDSSPSHTNKCKIETVSRPKRSNDKLRLTD